MDILLLKCRVTWFLSFTHTEVSCCDVHESQIDLHVASSVLQRAFGLYV